MHRILSVIIAILVLYIGALLWYQSSSQTYAFTPQQEVMPTEEIAVLGAEIDAKDELLITVSKDPILIQVQMDPLSTLILSPSEIESFIHIDHNGGDPHASINDEIFTRLIHEKNMVIRRNDTGVDIDDLRAKIQILLDERILGKAAHEVVVQSKIHSNTDGSHAQKYIEIDISQHKMYLFENGTQVAVHGISSGLYYPTPVGSFKILNKAKNAYSEIYHVFMPYWMAFYYGSDVQAYFGIHELPYSVSADGTRHQRPRDFIGQPKTGGCVALDVGVARAVYEFSEVGMPVFIFQ